MTNRSLFVEPGHFYSPIADPTEAAEAIRAARTDCGPAGVKVNEKAQIALLEALAPAMRDCSFPEHKEHNWRYYFYNDQYSYGDAVVFQAMLRHFRPKQIIEIGSGYSSAVILDTRDRYGVPNKVTCIEPYPARLNSLIGSQDRSSIQLIVKKVQEVEPKLFEALGRNDFLFIDSSHVSKTGSDVNHILFEVLPRLHSGVIIHFHDVFWPFEYPLRWAVHELRSWNEIYTLRALLTDNNRLTIIFFNDFLSSRFPGICSSLCPSFMRNPGGGLWLRVQA